MTSNQMQKAGPGPGVTVPKVPIISPTPHTSLNIINKSEIVARPAKGINNQESINNKQMSNQVYLDNKEKIKINPSLLVISMDNLWL